MPTYTYNVVTDSSGIPQKVVIAATPEILLAANKNITIVAPASDANLPVEVYGNFGSKLDIRGFNNGMKFFGNPGVVLQSFTGQEIRDSGDRVVGTPQGDVINTDAIVNPFNPSQKLDISKVGVQFKNQQTGASLSRTIALGNNDIVEGRGGPDVLQLQI
jgi:hypothetical protein